MINIRRHHRLSNQQSRRIIQHYRIIVYARDVFLFHLCTLYRSTKTISTLQDPSIATHQLHPYPPSTRIKTRDASSTSSCAPQQPPQCS